MWSRRPLDDVLSSASKVALLRAACMSPAPLTGRELARRAGVSSSRASVALGELVASGALRCRDLGSANTYEPAKPELPLIAALRRLFEEEARRYEALVLGLGELMEGEPRVLSAVLFGSEARGDARPGSDTDVMLLVEEHDDALERLIDERCAALAAQHDLSLAWHTADRADVVAWERGGHEFWRSVRADGVRLWGTSLEVLAERWQTGAGTSEKRSASGTRRKRSVTRTT